MMHGALMAFLEFLPRGTVPLPWWGYVLVTAFTVHLTVIGVTIYYHRDQAHRALDLHPALRQFFRFWVWFTSAMVCHQWVAVHRKHHAFVEREGDPHSPQLLGLGHMLGNGARVYQLATMDPATIETYGRGTPNDWLERFYTRFPHLGVTVLLIVEIILFGLPGVAIWGIQMLNMPVLASGLINGVGHHSGYRNFDLPDASHNILPIGILAGGEELHNNHHAFPSSARFSVRRFEFDIGWMYIRVLSALGLARVRRVFPRPHLSERPARIDVDSVRAVVANRMHVLRAYRREVLIPMLRRELAERRRERQFRHMRRLLLKDSTLMDSSKLSQRERLIERYPGLAVAWRYRERLRAIWEERAASNERVRKSLSNWCQDAEASGIESLARFATRLTRYRLAPST
ncbi:MAG TPA: transposase [Gammaproteobacteria bacterium]|nr:transposase [Gammaproteobacteria bacterium]